MGRKHADSAMMAPALSCRSRFPEAEIQSTRSGIRAIFCLFLRHEVLTGSDGAPG